MINKLVKSRFFDVEVSGRCNVKCKFCPREVLPKMDFMSEETFKSLLQKVPDNVLGSLSFAGIGEPLMNPLLPSFIKMARKHKPKVHVGITTNATLLSETKLHELLESGVNHLDISFNGIDAQTYEEHMRGAKFQEVLNNITNAVKILNDTKSKTNLEINFVITDSTLHKLPEIKKFWADRGIYDFRIDKVHDRSGLLSNSSFEINKIKGIIGGKCDIFDFINFVSWQGDIHFCCHDMCRLHKLGNINTDSWSDIDTAKQNIRDKQLWPKMCHECTDEWRYTIKKEFLSNAIKYMGKAVMKKFR